MSDEQVSELFDDAWRQSGQSTLVNTLANGVLALDESMREQKVVSLGMGQIVAWLGGMLWADQQVAITDHSSIASLDEGSVISWRAYPQVPESEVVAIVHHNEDGTVWLAHSGAPGVSRSAITPDVVTLPARILRMGTRTHA